MSAHSHFAHVGPKEWERGWEAEPRLGWDTDVGSLTGLESGREVWGCLTWEEVMVKVGIGGWGECVLAMLKHGVGVGGGEATQLGAEIKED